MISYNNRWQFLLITLAATALLSLILLSCKAADSTGPEDETAPPVISDIWVSSLYNTATVHYYTDQPAKGIVEYDLVTGAIDDSVTLLSATPDTELFVEQHEVDLHNLQPMQEYVYRIRAWTASSMDTVSHLSTFSTPDSTERDTSCSGLEITDLEIIDITDVSASIVWTTDLPADSRAAWGTSSDNLEQTTQDDELVTDHLIVLTNLDIDTEYFVRIASVADPARFCVSQVMPFTTDDEPSAPIISNLQVEATLTSATVTWDTNKEADSRVAWGLSQDNLENSVEETTEYILSHEIEIPDLTPYTTYYGQASSVDEAELRGDSEIFTFFTGPDDSLIISNVVVDTATSWYADITWLTNWPADTRIFYGLSRQVLPEFLILPEFIINHSVRLEELLSDTTYYFTVRAVDSLGQNAEYDTLDFRTNPGLIFYAPDTSSGIGQSIYFPIHILWAENLTAVELVISYNPLYVSPVSVAEDGITPGPFTTENDHFFFQREINRIASEITIQVTWRISFDGDIPVDTQADGDGVLAYIEFETLINGYSPINYEADRCRAFSVRSIDEGIEFDIENGGITVE